MFKQTAPKYRQIPGLVRKYYLFDGSSRTGGGVYLWHSRADAERLYSPEWRQTIAARYGAEPTISYFDTPVVVDNVAGEIEAD